MLIKILLLVILIVINGIFSATEIAFLSLNKYELNKEIKNGNKKGNKILNLINDSSTFLSAIQIAITFSGFLASAFAAESFASEIAAMINVSFLTTETLTTILIVLITLILSYFTLVFGELVPKKIGLAYSKRISFLMVDVIYAVIAFFKPFIFILKGSVNLIVKLFKIKKTDEKDEELIKDTIIDSKLEELEKNLLFNVFEFNDTKISQVMTPKKDVVFINIDDSKDDVLKTIIKHKYTRFPVVKDNEIIGVINVKDFILKGHKTFNLKKYIRDLSELEHDTIIDDAFLLLSSNHEVMASVIKDGEFIGIVTLEDIIEEVVGNVFDEYN